MTGPIDALHDYGVPFPPTGPAPARVDRRREVLQVGAFLDQPMLSVPERCEGLLPSEGLAAIIGAEKEGKSLLGLQLGLCIASGDVPFLGRKVFGGTVLLVEEEGTVRAMQDRVRRQAAKLGLLQRLADLPLHLAVRQRFRIDREADIAALEAEVERTGAGVVIIGPLAQIASFDENRSSEFNPIAQSLVDLVARRHVLIVLIHHRRKADTKSRRPRTIREFFDSTRGTNALTAALDTGIGLQRDPEEDNGVIHLLLRDSESERIHLEFDRHSLTVWATDGPVPTFDKAPLGAVEARLEAAYPNPVARNAVATALSVSPTTARERLDLLVAQSRAEKAAGARGAVLYRWVPQGKEVPAPVRVGEGATPSAVGPTHPRPVGAGGPADGSHPHPSASVNGHTGGSSEHERGSSGDSSIPVSAGTDGYPSVDVLTGRERGIGRNWPTRQHPSPGPLTDGEDAP